MPVDGKRLGGVRGREGKEIQGEAYALRAWDVTHAIASF